MRGAALVAVVTLAVASLSGSGVLVQTDPPAFHDAHVHLNDADAWLRLMDGHGIGRAVVLRGRAATHEALLDAAARWPGRLTPFVSVSPEHREYRGAWERDDPALAQVADSLLAGGGFHGIGEISVTHFPGAGFPEADFDPAGRLMRALMEVAREHRVPVLVHAELTRLREFEALLTAFPDVTVLWAHGGYAPLFLVERLLRRHPNLTVELSARTWVEHPRSPDYTILRDGRSVWPAWLALVEAMPERFVVGTDASLRSAASDAEKIGSVASFLAQLSPAPRALVATDNMERILGTGR